MKTVSEVSRLTGVSVRALHHYDAIGLLPPANLTEAGYRLYDDAALRRLQSILLFRELRFSLKEIKTMLDSPAFDPDEALSRQITLLEMERRRLDALIAQAREIQRKGVAQMDFSTFDKSRIDEYREEALKKWGGTDAWKDFEQKQREGRDFAGAGRELMALLGEIAALRPLAPESKAVQRKIRELQSFITEHFYACTDEILAGLGEMYVSDDRMQRSIDRAGGDGAAQFIHQAIRIYCGR